MCCLITNCEGSEFGDLILWEIQEDLKLKEKYHLFDHESKVLLLS